jgi:hypothetical protein
MKKTSICLITLMILGMLAIPMAQVIRADSNGTSDTGSSVLTGTVPLSASDIAVAWPNLPTAQQLFNSVGVVSIDTSTLGKQGSWKNPDPNAPTSLDLSSVISNCTSNDITVYGIVQNNPHIWLQYNSTIWVEVPASYLNTTVQPYAAAIQQLHTIGSLGPYPMNTTALAPSSASSSTPQTYSTWAIGEYDDPSQINFGYPVLGALSYGEWSCYPPNTLPVNTEIITDVLSMVNDQGVVIQAIMAIANAGQGTQWYVTYNYWINNVVSGGTPMQPWSGSFTPSANTFYNEFIQLSGSNWNLYWDFYKLYGISVGSDSSPHMQLGNAPHAELESNDFTLADFTNHQNYWDVIGGGQQTINGNTVYEPAIGYYFDGVWAPTLPYQTAPAGYVYVSPNNVTGQQVGTNSLPGWGGSTPNELSYPDVLPIGLGQSGGTNSEGNQLWSLNPVP